MAEVCALLLAGSFTAGLAAQPDRPRASAYQQPTAEALLKELRRSRSRHHVIAPASGMPGTHESDRKALLPEGFMVVGRTGWLEQDGTWWRFVFDPAEQEPPTKLLPNANLEALVRTVTGSASRIKFTISGEMTVFGDENYLLVRSARRAEVPDHRPTRPEGSQKPEEAPAHGGRVPTASSPAPAEGPGPVEDVLASLQQQRPREAMIPLAASQPNQTRGGGRPGRAGTAFTGALKPDGTPIVRRPGRLVHDGTWWAFAFESDHPDYPEPPMRLLPNQSVALMAEASQGNEKGVVFLVSGEVTAFFGENFLLPRAAMRRTDLGNLRK